MLFKEPVDRLAIPSQYLLESDQHVLGIKTGFPAHEEVYLLYEEGEPVYYVWKQVATIMLRGVHTTREQNLLISVTLRQLSRVKHNTNGPTQPVTPGIGSTM